MKVCERDIVVRGRLIRTATPELDQYESTDHPEEMLDGLKRCGRRVDLFSFMQHAPDTTPKFTYHMEWDNLAVLPVSTFENWWKNQISSLPRNRARQAEKKGVTLREAAFDDALVRGMWAIYNESPVRQGKKNLHYGKDLETVRREEATFLDQSIFIGAFLGEELIGFIKLVHDQHRIRANMMNIVSMVKYRDKAPTNALIARAVQACADRGIQYLLYQKYTYGNKKPDSLTKFKEVNGFQRVELPRYYIPLTPAGRMALRLRLHHRLQDHLPETLLEKLRDLRGMWYSRMMHSPAES